MSQELDNFQLEGKKSLPNATAVLVLGILSIVMCWTYGVIGFILSIVALVLHSKDKEIYITNPAVYEESFKNSKAGKICAIIGLVLSALFVLYFIAIFMFFTAVATSTFANPQVQDAIQQIADSVSVNRH